MQNLKLLEYLGEPFRCHVKNVQCLAIPVEKHDITARSKSSQTTLIKPNFAEHIFNTHHTHTNMETNL